MVATRPPRRWLAAALSALAFFVSTGAQGAEPYRFLKGPFLQGLGATSTLIRWEGSDTRAARVRVAAAGFEKVVTTEGPLTFHSVEVPGLTPSTIYTYVVQGDGDAEGAQGTFTTAPDRSVPFSFLVYGDNRTDAASHENVVRAMRAVPSDFLVNTGDMVADGSDASLWSTFFSIETPLLRDRCVFACVGNHELVGRGAATYVRYFHPTLAPDGRTLTPPAPDSLYYSMRWSSARFFVLNAMASWENGPEREWLEHALERADTEEGLLTRIVVMHHGPYSSGPHGPNTALAHAGIVDLFRKHHVTFLVAGHDHLYERGESGGLHYIVTGGGGAPLYKQSRAMQSPAEAVESSHHFVAVRVDQTKVTVNATRSDGTLIEACTFEGTGPWGCENRGSIVAAASAAAAATTDRTQPRNATSRSCHCSVVTPTQHAPTAAVLGAAALLLTRFRRRSCRRTVLRYPRLGVFHRKRRLP